MESQRDQSKPPPASILDAALNDLDDSDSECPPHPFGPAAPSYSNADDDLLPSEAELAASFEGMMRQLQSMDMGDFHEAMEAFGMSVPQVSSMDPSQTINNNNDNINSNKNNNNKKNSKSKNNTSGNNKNSSSSSNDMDRTIENLLNNIPPLPSKLPTPPAPILDTVMKQLLSRDLMYHPMKEVATRFPAWLARNKTELSPEEYGRYGLQYQCFQRIVRVYETEPENFGRLMELMEDVQEYGQPPPEIIKELAPDLEFDGEGMPMMGMGMPPFMPGMPFPGGDEEQCTMS